MVVCPCSLKGTPEVTIANRCILWGCCTPSRTHVSKRIVAPLRGLGRPNESSDPVSQANPCAHQSSCPLRLMHPNLGVPLIPVHPNLLVASHLGKPLGVFRCPRCPLAQLVHHLGGEVTPSSVSLRTWASFSAPF
jgi:hypothetical protein